MTLIHSRTTFLPTFLPAIDLAIKSALSDLGVNTVLGQRVNLTKLSNDLSSNLEEGTQRPIRVESISDPQKFWDADLVVSLHFSSNLLRSKIDTLLLQLLCTGQVPNTSLMSEFCPSTVAGGSTSSNYITVNRNLQIQPSTLGPSPIQTSFGAQISCDCSTSYNPSQEEIYKNVFAIGDCIDGFGSIKAGHTGWNQAEVAAQNILKLIKNDVDLLKYEKSVPMIRLTLGLVSFLDFMLLCSHADIVCYMYRTELYANFRQLNHLMK